MSIKASKHLLKLAHKNDIKRSNPDFTTEGGNQKLDLLCILDEH